MRLATAQWADPALVEDKYLYRDGTVWLGRSASRNQTPLGFDDDRHVCLVSGSRGGKGTSLIINNLCLWPGSVVVIDPKGENATVTAERRGKGTPLCEGLGQAVHVLDPFNAATVDDAYRSRFNPLDALSPDDEEVIDEATLIADSIVVIHQESKDPFWDESARAMVKALLLHILTAPEYKGRRNLVTLRELITRGDWQKVETLRQSGDESIPAAQGLLWQGVAENLAFHGLVSGTGEKMVHLINDDPRVFHGVLQVASLNTEFIDSPGMQRCLSASDFKLSELKTSKKGMSLYLSLPQRFMSTHYRWLRMMIGLTVSKMESTAGQPASGHRMLLLLDEFAGLERMKVIENAVAQMAGFGVKMFFVVQNLTQLKDVYKDKWETFLANSGLKLFFNLEDHFSRDHVSKLIGDTEIILDVHSEGDSSTRSESESESESQSRSKSESESESEGNSFSRSESRGDSLSHGHSETEGTNRSASRSQSHGVNKSHSKTLGGSISSTHGKSWSPNSYFSTSSSGTVSESSSTSDSEGTSDSWSTSESEGTSRGRSDSVTEGNSRTSGTSEGETSGTTHGTTQGSTRGSTRGSMHGSASGRTSGKAETIHRRPLIAPDEIGKMFARIDDTDRAAYPGLGLAVMAGQEPVAFRRVNYFEDIEFIGYFQPHPDYAFSAPVKFQISAGALEKYKSHFKGLHWKPAIRRGMIVRAGEIIGNVIGPLGLPVAPIRAPVSGRVVGIPIAMPSLNPLIPGAKLENIKLSLLMPNFGIPNSIFSAAKSFFLGDFEILYYENGVAPCDPFADLAALCREKDLQKERERLAEERRKRDEEARKREEAARKAAAEKAAREAAQIAEMARLAAVQAAALREWEQRKLKVRVKRGKWILAAIVGGMVLLVDVAITLYRPGGAGIAIAVAAAVLLGVCGEKIRQNVVEERAIVYPVKEPLLTLANVFHHPMPTTSRATEKVMASWLKKKP